MEREYLVIEVSKAGQSAGPLFRFALQVYRGLFVPVAASLGFITFFSTVLPDLGPGPILGFSIILGALGVHASEG